MEQTNEVKVNDNSNLCLSSDASLNTFQSQQVLNITEKATVTLTNAYHLSEIKQNEAIIKTAKGIIWAGFAVIAIGVIFSFIGKTDAAIVTTASGVITEFISGIMFAFVTMSNKSKLKYFEQLSITEEGEKHMKMILSLDNKKAQEKLIEKMVQNYCERRK